MFTMIFKMMVKDKKEKKKFRMNEYLDEQIN